MGKARCDSTMPPSCRIHPLQPLHRIRHHPQCDAEFLPIRPVMQSFVSQKTVKRQILADPPRLIKLVRQHICIRPASACALFPGWQCQI